MTIQELYDYAKEKNIENYELEAQHADDGGCYYGSRSIRSEEIEINDDMEILIV